MTLTVMTRRRMLATAVGALGLTLTACAQTSDSSSSTSGTTVTVLTHDSFNVPQELIDAFTRSSGYTLEIVNAGDAGELVNKLVLTKDAPLGDAVFGIDNTFASRALEEGIIDTSLNVTIPTDAEQYIVDSTPALVPIDFGEVCLNVDSVWFREKGLTPPTSFEDLITPAYKGLLVAINPATSSTGLAFLLATIGHFGENGFANYWRDLCANGAKIVDGWTEAYYTDFSGGGDTGTYPIVVSYSSSPAATVTQDGSASTTASLLSTATRQVEYAGALSGGSNPQGAKAFIEWMLSADVQQSIPDNMYMYPVNPEVTLSATMERFGPLSDAPIAVAPEEIAAHRQEWLATWAEAVGA